MGTREKSVCLPRSRPFFLAPIYFLTAATQAILTLESKLEGQRGINNACFLVLLEVKSGFKYIPVRSYQFLVMLGQFSCQVLL